MIKISIPTIIDFGAINRSFIKANDKAILVAGAKAVPRVKAGQPQKTGALAEEVSLDLYKSRRTKMLSAAINVQGHRHVVAFILENGTKDGRIQARHTFEKIGQAIAAQVELDYEAEFLSALGDL